MTSERQVIDESHQKADAAISGFGFLTMALGAERYFRMAENLALSLRRHMPGIPIGIVTDRRDPGPLFDCVIPIRSFRVAGTLLKTDLYSYSPFQETLFVDSDCIATRPFWSELNAIRDFEFTPVVSRYLARGDSDLWLVDLDAALDQVKGKLFPKFNGGVYFFRKGTIASAVFMRAQDLCSRAGPLGIKHFDDAGPGDETLIGLSLSTLDLTNLYDDGGNLMRTPIGLTGKLRVDALGGGCSFVKEGTLVNPAICHFCVAWSFSPAYRLAEYSLRHGHVPSPARRLVYGWVYYIDWIAHRIKAKFGEKTKGVAGMPIDSSPLTARRLLGK